MLAAVRASPLVGSHPFKVEVLQDLGWFVRFASKFNGIVLLPVVPLNDWVIEYDSTLKAGGVFSKLADYAEEYPSSITDKCTHINQLEAVNLVHALLFLLPPDPFNYCIVINTDNLPSQQVLQSGSGKDSVLCGCARQIWLFSASNSCEIAIVHREGVSLVLADNLSRSLHKPAARRLVEAECSARSLEKLDVTFSLENIEFIC